MRYSPEAQIENDSRGQVESFFSKHGWVAVPINPDLGEDFVISIYDIGESTGLSFNLQLKGTDDINKYKLKQADEISYQFTSKHILHWAGLSNSVFLCIWDINLEKGWYVWIVDAIKYLQENNPGWEKNEYVNIRFPLEQELSDENLVKIRFQLAKHYFPILARGRDVQLQIGFKFPETLEGKELKSRLETSIKTGEPIKISGEYIRDFNFPDWYERIFGEIIPKEIQITELKNQLPVPIQLAFSSKSYENVNIPYIELVKTKQGIEVATYNNFHQNTPFHFETIIDFKNSQHTINFSVELGGMRITQADMFLRMLRIASENGILTITSLKTGKSQDYFIPDNVFPEPHVESEELIRKLFKIEKIIQQHLFLSSDGSYSNIDVYNTDILLKVLESGRNQKNGKTASFNLFKNEIQQLIRIWKEKQRAFLRIEGKDSFITIMNQEIHLGPVLQIIEGDFESDITDLEQWLENAKDSESKEIYLDNYNYIEEYKNWLIPRAAE